LIAETPDCPPVLAATSFHPGTCEGCTMTDLDLPFIHRSLTADEKLNVAQHVDKYDNRERERFHEQIRQYSEALTRYNTAFDKRLADISSAKLRPHSREAEQRFPIADLPPQPTPPPIVIPTGMKADNRPSAGGQYLPCYYWLLAAIHDATLPQNDPIIEEPETLNPDLAFVLKAPDPMLNGHPFTSIIIAAALPKVKSDLDSKTVLPAAEVPSAEACSFDEVRDFLLARKAEGAGPRSIRAWCDAFARAHEGRKPSPSLLSSVLNKVPALHCLKTNKSTRAKVHTLSETEKAILPGNAPDPAIEAEAHDAEWARMIDEADAPRRAELNAMNAAEQRVEIERELELRVLVREQAVDGKTRRMRYRSP